MIIVTVMIMRVMIMTRYCVRSQLRMRGVDDEEGMLLVKPREGEDTIRTEDILDLIEKQGDSIAVVMLSGVQYYTGNDITKTTKRPLTAGTLFKNSMLALMKTIHSKEPHYVRCIKPNGAKSPVLFDKELVEHQVRSF